MPAGQKPCLKCDQFVLHMHAKHDLCPDCRPKPKKRKCLKCQRMFKSTHVGNRLCKACTKSVGSGDAIDPGSYSANTRESFD